MARTGILVTGAAGLAGAYVAEVLQDPTDKALAADHAAASRSLDSPGPSES